MTEFPTVAVDQLDDAAVVLDVREDDEFAAGHAPGAVHIPLGDVPARLGEIPAVDGALPVVCRRGGRSLRAAQWLESQGIEVVNVDGGMQAWESAGKKVVTDSGADPTII